MTDNAAENKRLEAGLSYLAWLKSPEGGTEKTAVPRFKGVSQRPISARFQQSVAGIHTGLKGIPSGRTAKVDVAGVELKGGVAKGTLAKQSSIEGAIRAVLRGGGSAGSGIANALRNVGASTGAEARGFMHGSTGLRDEFGELIKEPGWIKRQWVNRIQHRNNPKKHLLTSKELARRRGPDYLSGYLRGKNVADQYGTPSMYDKMNTAFRRPDGSFSAGSVIGGLSDTGLLTADSISRAVGKTTAAVSGLPAAQAAEARRRNMLLLGGAGVGGLGAGIIGSKMLSKKNNDTNQ